MAQQWQKNDGVENSSELLWLGLAIWGMCFFLMGCGFGVAVVMYTKDTAKVNNKAKIKGRDYVKDNDDCVGNVSLAPDLIWFTSGGTSYHMDNACPRLLSAKYKHERRSVCTVCLDKQFKKRTLR